MAWEFGLRLPEETKTNGQANCLEKEMFASIELESSVYARKYIFYVQARPWRYYENAFDTFPNTSKEPVVT